VELSKGTWYIEDVQGYHGIPNSMAVYALDDGRIDVVCRDIPAGEESHRSEKTMSNLTLIAGSKDLYEASQSLIGEMMGEGILTDEIKASLRRLRQCISNCTYQEPRPNQGV